MFKDFAKEKGLKTSNISLFKEDFKSLLKELGVDMEIEHLSWWVVMGSRSAYS